MKNKTSITNKAGHIFYVLLPTVLLFTGCKDNTKECLEWINKHPKPIIVHCKSQNGITLGYRYTLIDSCSNTTYYNEVKAVLPDTIVPYGW